MDFRVDNMVNVVDVSIFSLEFKKNFFFHIFGIPADDFEQKFLFIRCI